MLELLTKEIRLSTGHTFTVAENDFSAARKLHRLREEAKTAVNGSTGALTFFRTSVYPILAATAVGDVPDVMAAYALPRAELDAWWLDVWELNSDWFDSPVQRIAETEQVTFRDGSSLTLSEARGLPSFVLRLTELEDEAEQNPSPDEDTQVFRLAIYPKMAAAVTEGDVPPADQVMHWPSTERMKWYSAARRRNSDWFLPLEVEVEQSTRERQKEEKKKGARKPAG